MLDQEQRVYTALNGLGIPYERYEHRAANTMVDCEDITEQMGIGVVHCKNLFLCNRQNTEFFLVLVCENKKFRTAEFSPQIGKARLSFGSAEKLFELLGEEPGSVSPMGLMFDTDKKVQVYLDKDLETAGKVCVHPCINTVSIVLAMGDLLRFIRWSGHEAGYVTISGINDCSQH